MYRVWTFLRAAISALICVLAIVIGCPNPASAQDAPIVAKSFGAASIAVGASTSLTIRIQGQDRLTGVALTDTLPEGLVVATPNGVTGTCQGAFATIAAAPGSSSISLSGGTIDAGIGCELTLNVTALTAGTKTNSAAATSDQGAGKPASASLTVERAATTTTVASSANPSAAGQSVTFTATVTGPGPGGTPTGTVTFQDGSTTLGSAALSAAGTVTYSTSALSVGSRTVTAVYAGDAAFAGSTSLALTQAVAKVPTTITVTSSANPSVAGKAVTLTATATGSGGAPTGTVTFQDGSTTLGTATLSTAGNAILITSMRALGSRTITAAYGGDHSFAASISSPFLQTVQSEAGIVNSLQSGIILLIAIALAALLVLLRRVIFLVIARVLRVLTRPLARPFRALSRWFVRLLRALRVISRAPPQQRPVQSFVGLSVGAISGAFTETEQAIGESFDPASITIQRHRRIFCTWLHPVGSPSPEYTKVQAEKDFKKAELFFSAEIKVETNALNLYDDIDSAYIVRLFKDSDITCFYVLSEFRKIINANVMILAVLFSFIVSAVAVANVVGSSSIDFYGFFNLADNHRLPVKVELFGFALDTRIVLNKFVFGVLSCAAGFGLMWLFYHIAYEQFQRFNGQQMNNFLVRYLADININFTKIHTNATQAVVADKDIQEVQRDTVLWITNLQWMAFRAFFIEHFLRTIVFQIRRNSIYALFLIPLLFIALMLVVAAVFGIQQLEIFNPESELYRQNSFYVFFAWLLLAYYGYLNESLAPISESIEAQWHKFREMNLLEAMTRIMASYATQLDQWRSRFRDRGGGPGTGI